MINPIKGYVLVKMTATGKGSIREVDTETNMSFKVGDQVSFPENLGQQEKISEDKTLKLIHYTNLTKI